MDIDWMNVAKIALRVWVALAVGLALAYAGDRYKDWLEREKEKAEIQGKTITRGALVTIIVLVLIILAVIDVIDPLDFVVILFVFYVYSYVYSPTRELPLQ